MDTPHVVTNVQCDLCSNIWLAVFPTTCDRLECPKCHNLTDINIVETDK